MIKDFITGFIFLTFIYTTVYRFNKRIWKAVTVVVDVLHRHTHTHTHAHVLSQCPHQAQQGSLYPVPPGWACPRAAPQRDRSAGEGEKLILDIAFIKIDFLPRFRTSSWALALTVISLIVLTWCLFHAVPRSGGVGGQELQTLAWASVGPIGRKRSLGMKRLIPPPRGQVALFPGNLPHECHWGIYYCPIKWDSRAELCWILEPVEAKA